MLTSGRVVKIFISPNRGEPMVEVASCQAVAGAGLAGDRYAANRGSWSRAERKAIRHVTLIAAELIADANAELGVPYSAGETRRNIVVKGIPLGSLRGREFAIGTAHMRWFEVCDPCTRPAKLAGKPGFDEAFRGIRGGIRAEVLQSGTIAVGDEIVAMDHTDADVEKMTCDALCAEVLRLRQEIREHRDQRGDDRCWLDDVALHALLPDAPPALLELPPWEEMEKRCAAYFENRQCAACPHAIPPDAILDPREWDGDLENMTDEKILAETLRLRQGIRLHRDIGEKRTAIDDEALCALLPEKLLADSRLTGPRFLPSCRNFWETRQGQNPQKLHEW